MIAETLGVFAGGYALLVGGMAVFQRDMIYHPGADFGQPAQSGVAEMTAVPVRTGDDLVITGWYAPPPTADGVTVVLLHGNAGTIAHRAHKARALMDAGHGVFLVEYRGYGGNPGKPSQDGLFADARAVLAWLKAHGTADTQLWLYGESLGTGVAVQMAFDHPRLAGLILEAPFTALPALAPAYVLPGVAEMLMVDHFDSRARIPEITLPLLVIHGEQDGVVPVTMGREMLAAAAGTPKQGVFVPQAGHNDVWQLGGAEATLSFLDSRKR